MNLNFEEDKNAEVENKVMDNKIDLLKDKNAAWDGLTETTIEVSKELKDLQQRHL